MFLQPNLIRDPDDWLYSGTISRTLLSMLQVSCWAYEIMNPNGNSRRFQMPLGKLCFDPKSSRSTATRRDSLAAELETDPQLSAAKRLQRTQALNSALSHAGLERQLLVA
ncbi:hypothetical protein BKA70DRAFT_1319387 [Coprinopsis sp. MPI-PUGE-AT-0042]|nr:hypothetical protein BKA70DRAFT_1319387 [Coprinopsis sp. MPI-PUGE-AT-0042]